jgi:putative ABC transport system substrate-binding protein
MLTYVRRGPHGGHVQRREFITLLSGAAAAWPLSVYAQTRLPRVGVLLYAGSVSPTDLPIAAALARIGYVDGRNITYVVRAAEGDTSRMPRLARELVAEKPDVIVAASSSAAVALLNATRDIPVVMTIVGDPIAVGLTSSISRPTHNVTGFTISSLSLAAKRLEVLHDIVPSLHKAAYLWMPENPVAASFKSNVQRAADKLGIKLVPIPLTSYADIDAAFSRAEREQVTAVLVETSEFAVRFSGRIVDHCLFYELPCLHTFPFEVRNGALISYGPKEVENYSGAAAYADRILKGAKIAELPFVEPTEIKLTINLRTAHSLGVVFPPTVLVRADEVVE